MDANSPKLTWSYDGNGRQTAEWNIYSFSVKFDMQDSSGCYWHLSMWQTAHERLTRTVILRTSDLSECHSKAREMAWELSQFMGLPPETGSGTP